jgi:hypothetical protein
MSTMFLYLIEGLSEVSIANVFWMLCILSVFNLRSIFEGEEGVQYNFQCIFRSSYPNPPPPSPPPAPTNQQFSDQSCPGSGYISSIDREWLRPF